MERGHLHGNRTLERLIHGKNSSKHRGTRRISSMHALQSFHSSYCQVHRGYWRLQGEESLAFTRFS